MQTIKALLIILSCFFLCYLIYKTLTAFIFEIKRSELLNKYLKKLDEKYEQMLNTEFVVPSLNVKVNDYDTDSTLDKSDEELLKEWNDLWGGNPPCELDLKAIREEEKRERENNKE